LGEEEGWEVVKWSREDPTWYGVEVGRGGWLVFSEHYSPLWRLREREPLPVFDAVNVYRVAEGGRYEAKFVGQEKVRTGMIVSGVSLVGVLIIIQNSKIKRQNYKAKIKNWGKEKT